ncbi:Uncharacterized protein YpbB [Gracilibacillus ureilyticus]|uniref:Uncharacterized protein YpbB n=1 Tax=Gracilibacillus ureilyticus TaxID=531814 RepID=A0A1H9LRR2_9BACI|nr:helix-turn-helix domain-containing protein [Gracilibacillus ureilyticus]SER14114.1 Uncharacterized protein YpbB [Gracilibacillus ureilyticus]
MFQYILLHCIKALKAERSLANIFYLLTGKKSTQTIQDSHLYNLTDYFGVYRSLKRVDFNNAIDNLVQKSYIVYNKQGFAQLSDAGKYHLTVQAQQYQDLHFRGMVFERMAPPFLATLILLIQTATNIFVNNYRFIPVIDNSSAQSNVKQFLKQKDLDISILLRDLYGDLYKCFTVNRLPQSSIEIFTDHITSAKEIGLSQHQLASKYIMTKEDVHCYLMNVVHLMLDESKHPDKYNVFPYIINQQSDLPVTESALATYKLYSRGHTIGEIAAYRSLKESTIQDHIIEIAYAEKVEWTRHMGTEIYNTISEVMEKTNTKQLKILKSLLPEHISYFQIKLVIALWHKPL